MKINYLSVKDDVPPKGYWDMAFINDLISDLPDSEREVFVIPGAYQADVVDEINKKLQKHKSVLVFITSDEEGKFDCKKLNHDNMIHYHQYGWCKNTFPIGYTTDTRELIKKNGLMQKDLTYFFAGQLNSHERKNLAMNLVNREGGLLIGTNGFSQGISREDYYENMIRAMEAPSPGGWVSPDSFRFYEALEAGAVPTDYPEYMVKIFPDMPRPQSWTPFFANKMFAWWIAKKMILKQQLKYDLDIKEALTVIIPTSPIPSHPSTEIIDKTIESIRFHTGADIIITIDGVREEQEEQLGVYQEYIRRLLWKCNYEYKNVMPLFFDNHSHQVGMMKEALKRVITPLVMYVEHDTPLVTDEEIDLLDIIRFLFSGKANLVRFHYEAKIPKAHEYLMVHEHDIPGYIATKQWSQRPHIARTDFYREIMKFFSDDANCFIEDLIYGRCVENEWKDWKLFIYAPGENIKRSLNLNGRGDERKFEKEQIW